MTDVPVETPTSGGPPAQVDTGELAETLAVAVEDEREALTLRQAKVDAVSPGVAEASVVTVRVGAGDPIANVRYLGDAPTVADVVWLLTNGPDRLVLGALGRGTPIGAIMAIGGTGGAPPGWWPCDGRSTSGYPKLAARYGSTIPNLAGLFIVGSGGSYAVGATGGVATNTAVPSHNHQGFDHRHGGGAHYHGQVVTAGVSGGTGVRTDYDSDFSGAQQFPQGVNTDLGGAGVLGTADGAAYVTGTTGTAAPGVENRPPFYALLWIIKFG